MRELAAFMIGLRLIRYRRRGLERIREK